jgi:hypothetical protein
MNFLKMLEEEVGAWSSISVHPHRFGGKEFRFGSAEVGHVHTGGVVDIPFPRSVRDALLADGLAEGHHWVPNSGWITFQMRNEAADLPRSTAGLQTQRSKSLHRNVTLRLTFPMFERHGRGVIHRRCFNCVSWSVASGRRGWLGTSRIAC